MKFAFRTLIFVGLFYAIAPLAYAETSWMSYSNRQIEGI